MNNILKITLISLILNLGLIISSASAGIGPFRSIEVRNAPRVENIPFLRWEVHIATTLAGDKIFAGELINNSMLKGFMHNETSSFTPNLPFEFWALNGQGIINKDTIEAAHGNLSWYYNE